ncbi:MAG: EutN/CcmL family microcompartment protein [Phycisphaeraceae bacterium]|nr:EutN/CcmL family microcompartment protein [Phycisphaeraceae bacterium]
MFLGRVKGHVTATVKDDSMTGRKLLIVEPLKVEYAQASNGDPGGPAASSGNRFEVTGRAIVAMDAMGAGEGQLVLVVQGSSARMAEGCNKIPVDAVVVGIVDSASVMGQKVV